MMIFPIVTITATLALGNMAAVDYSPSYHPTMAITRPLPPSRSKRQSYSSPRSAASPSPFSKPEDLNVLILDGSSRGLRGRSDEELGRVGRAVLEGALKGEWEIHDKVRRLPSIWYNCSGRII
jgi:hypothetical protein